MNIKTLIILLAQLCTLVSSLPTSSLRGHIDLAQEPRPHLVRQPEDVTAVIGETVKMSCVVANREESSRCQWTRDGFGLGQDLELAGYERYRMEDSQTGECSLLISPVLLTDEAVYQCQVGTVRSSNIKLVVNSPPSLPYITQAQMGDIVDIEEGEEVELQCETIGAKPRAEIQWRDSKGEIILSNMLETVTKDSQPGTFRTVSSIKLQPTEDTQLSCAAYSDVFPAMKESRQLTLRTNYKPRLSLNVTSQHEIQAGHDVTVTCTSQARPEIFSYKWFINQEEVLQSENTDTITIANISGDLNGAEVRCQAENKVGQSEATVRLQVVFRPLVTRHPESVLARPGEKVSLHCGAQANPAPSYVWVRGADHNIAGVSDTLTLTAGPDTEDTYTCKVFSDGQELLSRPAILSLIRPPTVLDLHQKTARLGEAVVLHCDIFSLDNKTKINWTRNNDLVRPDGAKYRALPLVRNEKLGMFSSDLIIYNVQSEDLGHYGCFAQNEIGNDHREFLLEEERTTNWVTVVISVNTVIALVILAGISLWSRRERILKMIRRGNQNEPRLPVVQREVLPPIYKGRDHSVFEELLLDSGMGERDYLKLSGENKIDKAPGD